LTSHTRYANLKNIGGFVFCVQRKAALEKKHWRTGSSSQAHSWCGRWLYTNVAVLLKWKIFSNTSDDTNEI